MSRSQRLHSSLQSYQSLNPRAAQSLRWIILATLATVAVGMLARSAPAQTIEATQPAASIQVAALDASATVDTPVNADLPDAPGSVSSSAAEPSTLTSASAGFADPGHAVPSVAGRYDTVILPGQTAPHLSSADKFLSSVKDSVSPFAAVGWLVSAGYEQAANSSPNFPQTGKGFGQRLGSAAARDSSEEIFGYGVIAPILHEDPRYYKMGSGHNFIHRLFYAGTRPLFIRTDGGRQTINFAELGGDISGAYLTRTYYPQLNQTNDEVLRTFGSSIGGSAVGFVVSEFLADTLQAVHLKKAND